MIAVREATSAEHPALAEVLVAAFHRDPLAQWLYPDPDERDRQHRALFSAALRDPDATQRVDTTGDLSAAAIWRRSESPVEPDAPPDTVTGAAALFAAIAAAAPAPPFTNLVFVGARVSGTGAGSALLGRGLAGAEGRVALWTGNAANLPFYRRAGLAIVEHVATHGAEAWWLTKD